MHRRKKSHRVKVIERKKMKYLEPRKYRRLFGDQKWMEEYVKNY